MEWLEWFAPLLPATVIVAILLFFAKEVVEYIKRRRADARKGRAFRKLLARECELNRWTYERLRESFFQIMDDGDKGVAAEYSIKRLNSGELMFRREEPSGWNQGALPDTYTDVMSKVMLDIAILDKSLFASLEAAYDSAINLRHIRESLIHFIESDEEDGKAFLTGLPEHALDQLDGFLAILDKLHRECTGEALRFTPQPGEPIMAVAYSLDDEVLESDDIEARAEAPAPAARRARSRGAGRRPEETKRRGGSARITP